MAEPGTYFGQGLYPYSQEVNDAALRALAAVEEAASWWKAMARRFDGLLVDLEGVVARAKATPDEGADEGGAA